MIPANRMADERIQIALEHHRAGRLTRAQDEYRRILAENPADAEALQWMGVLLLQGGRVTEAMEHLERAAAIRPDDAAIQHNLAHVYLASGRRDDAIARLERAVELAPNQPEPWVALGLARFARRGEGDAQAAVEAFRKAHAAGLDSPEVHLNHAMALVAAGEYEQAVAACRAALLKREDYAAAHYYMALAHWGRGDLPKVRNSLMKAVEIDPGMARAWCALGRLDAELANYDIAISLLRRSIRIQPDYPAAHHSLGRVLEMLGRKQEAAQSYRDAVVAARGGMRRAPASQSLAELEQKLTGPLALEFHHALAGMAQVFPPSQVPTNALRKLFDKYAETFDDHLRGRLQYGAPELVTGALAAIAPERPLDILDMGCGTGLCGPMLRPLAQSLVGVDLSAAMIEKARQREVYDHLEVGDLMDALRKSDHCFDALVAADVLIYMGDLSPVLEAAKAALKPGGVMVFTLEAGGGDRYLLHTKTLRFTHSQPYIERVAALYGFKAEGLENVVLRTENEKPVAGFLIALRSGEGAEDEGTGGKGTRPES